MERLNKTGLAYYHSLIKDWILNLIGGTHPTVRVRPSHTDTPSVVETLYYHDNQLSEDATDDSITIKVSSNQMSFTIHCGNEAAVQKLLSGDYYLRFSFLSRKYTNAKWVCPSTNPDVDPDRNWAIGTGWDAIQLSEENCTYGGGNEISVSGPLIYDLVNGVKGIKPTQGDLPSNYPVERAMVFGTDAYPITNSLIFSGDKKIYLKGIIPYLQDTEQSIDNDTFWDAYTNAYSFKVKASVWYRNIVELPGESIGVISINKKREGMIKYQFKEMINNK